MYNWIDWIVNDVRLKLQYQYIYVYDNLKFKFWIYMNNISMSYNNSRWNNIDIDKDTIELGNNWSKRVQSQLKHSNWSTLINITTMKIMELANIFRDTLNKDLGE